MVTFGKKLKELREAAGLTQLELAEKVGIDRTTIARLEIDRAVPSWPVVSDLAKVLGVSCEAFPAMERSKGPKPGSLAKKPEDASPSEPEKQPRKRKGKS